jgi:CheY-like chemotaxis protein
MKGEEQKCLDAGCTGYVPKPIEVNRLLQTVAKLTGIQGAEIQAPVRIVRTEPAPTGPIKSMLPMDDPDFKEVVLEFVDRLGDRLGEIQHAWEENELTRVAQLAHWLKGSGGSAGFSAFTAPAKKLEALAKGGELDQIGTAIEELRQLASRIDVADARRRPVRTPTRDQNSRGFPSHDRHEPPHPPPRASRPIRCRRASSSSMTSGEHQSRSANTCRSRGIRTSSPRATRQGNRVDPRAEQPDLVLLDVMMPQVSGLQILEQLPPIRRFAISRADPDRIGRCNDQTDGPGLGATDFLAKPVDAGDLVPRARAPARQSPPRQPRPVLAPPRA